MDRKSSRCLDMDGLPKILKEDWVLLILAQKENVESSHGAVLMNNVFFFLKEFAPAVEGEFGFRGTGVGPYSKGVANAVNKLISDGLITIRMNEPTGINYYTLTDKGNGRFKSLLERIPENEGSKIGFARFLSRRMGNMGTFQYLCSVHPEYVFVKTAGDGSV
jgi:uncharacterized protein YwgA